MACFGYVTVYTLHEGDELRDNFNTRVSITRGLTITKLSDGSGTDCALISAGCFEAVKKVVIRKASVKDGVMDVAFLGAFTKLRKATSRFVISVRPSAWNSPAPTERLVMKSDIRVFFESLSRDRKFH